MLEHKQAAGVSSSLHVRPCSSWTVCGAESLLFCQISRLIDALFCRITSQPWRRTSFRLQLLGPAAAAANDVPTKFTWNPCVWGGARLGARLLRARALLNRAAPRPAADPESALMWELCDWDDCLKFTVSGKPGEFPAVFGLGIFASCVQVSPLYLNFNIIHCSVLCKAC